MWTSQYVRSRTGRLLLEHLAEEENHYQETDRSSVSADINFLDFHVFYVRTMYVEWKFTFNLYKYFQISVNWFNSYCKH